MPADERARDKGGVCSTVDVFLLIAFLQKPQCAYPVAFWLGKVNLPVFSAWAATCLSLQRPAEGQILWSYCHPAHQFAVGVNLNSACIIHWRPVL